MVHIEQIYTDCLAEAAYYLKSGQEAVVIDPLRETSPYVDRAERDGVKIKYIFLTHFHADFVSGHVDLAKKTGAAIVFGPNAETEFDIHHGQDGEEFAFGDAKLRLLHTPGHTMESSTYLLLDEAGKEKAIFSGDTLFIGDVGRPDLAVKSHLTQEDLARHLYKSLRSKIMVLPDDVVVYPAHGAGSACGKNMSSETFDTLGNQKQNNYALRQDMSEDEFVNEVITGLTAPPQYFPQNVKMNKGINTGIEEVLHRGTSPLSVEDFQKERQQGVLVLDVRSREAFAQAHVPGSFFIGLDGGFAPWVGALIVDVERPILLVVEPGQEEEAVTRLSRVGFDNTLGYLKGGIEAWKEAGEETDHVKSISAEELADRLDGVNLVDVRKPGEFEAEHAEAATHQALGAIMENLEEWDPNTIYHVHCAGGYRSMIAISILKANGKHELVNVAGGFDAMKQTQIPMTAYVCPSTLK